MAKINLACVECLSRNYITQNNKISNERLTLMKYCKKCGKHTTHKATK